MLKFVILFSLCAPPGLVFGQNQSQEISLSLKNATIQELINEIEAKTDFSVVYRDILIKDDRKITINVENKPLNEVLSNILESKGLKANFNNKTITLTQKKNSGKEQEIAKSQNEKDVTGVVLDDLGEPIIGAIVKVSGTTEGTMTASDGSFSIKVPENATLLITYMGYKSKSVSVAGQSTFKIILSEDAKALDEIVVVGFGTQKKVNLTGAIGVVNKKELESRAVMTVTQALQGLVPGLNISQNNGMFENKASMSVRGIGTIGQGSSGQPLILIDGMEGDISTINPQDIENISVLKDAAASSIYGSRAPFGVILITTKKGETGKPTINYNNSFRWSTPVLLPKMADSYTFATYFNDASTNSGGTPQFGAEHMERILAYQKGEITTNIIPNPNNPAYWADGYYYGNDNVDWYKALFRSWVPSQEHNLSVQGGSEKNTYYASLNYLDLNGLMQFNQDTYNRYSAAGKIGVQMTDWARLNYNTRFIREDYSRPSFLRNDLFASLAVWPTLPLYDPNGHLYDAPSPALNLRDGGRGIWQTDRLYQQAQLELEPIKKWKTFIEFNYLTVNENLHWDIQKTYNHDVAGNPYPANIYSNVHEDDRKDNFVNWNIYSEYSTDIATDHHFKIMGGFQSELFQSKVFAAQRDGILVPNLPYIDLTTGLDPFGKSVTPSVGGGANHWSTIGFFGRLNYDYRGKYLVEMNLRYDGTSRFRHKKRWNYFPSFSAGWNIAREDFWSSLEPYVGTLKVRSSYGALGNQNTSELYPTYQKIYPNPNTGSWLINGAQPSTVGPPALVTSSVTWETVSTWNSGIDFGLLNNRLTGSFDYFTRNTKNMMGPPPQLPATLGSSVPSTNNTDLITYGFELSLGWNDRLKNGLGYSLKLMLSDSQTKITKYPNEELNLSSYRDGMMYGEIWGYQTIGIAKTQEEMDNHLASLPNGGQTPLGHNWGAGDIMYADINGDGKIDGGANTLNDHGDRTIIGNSSPRYLFGIDLSADYKGFDFRAFFQGVMKRDYFQGTRYFWGSGNQVWEATCMEPHLDYFRDDPNHLLGQNLDSYFPRPLFEWSGRNRHVQSRYLQNASYIRLKNIQLGYTLPQSLVSHLKISKLRVFVSGENLWTGTKMIKVFDPETIDGGWNGSVYPLSKIMSFGLSINL